MGPLPGRAELVDHAVATEQIGFDSARVEDKVVYEKATVGHFHSGPSEGFSGRPYFILQTLSLLFFQCLIFERIRAPGA
ncbi:MAG: hypothetical protein ACE5JU_06010 [Candidatus Binatia bacterium]